jgi:hypothetical protein
LCQTTFCPTLARIVRGLKSRLRITTRGEPVESEPDGLVWDVAAEPRSDPELQPAVTIARASSAQSGAHAKLRAIR